jgi:hypothetical protein
MLNKQGVNAWIEFNWLRTGPNENSCECCKTFWLLDGFADSVTWNLSKKFVPWT